MLNVMNAVVVGPLPSKHFYMNQLEPDTFVLRKVGRKTHYSTFVMKFKLQVIEEYEKDLHFVEIDIEEDPEIAEAAGIMGTPCVQFFKEKEMLK